MLVDRARQVGLLGKPSTSSSGTIASGAGGCATNADRRHRRPGRLSSAGGGVAVGDTGVGEGLPQRACVLPARCVDLGLAARCRCRGAARCRAPRHQPATVGRSCVVVIADRVGAPARGARKRAASRSNHSTSMPAMPASRQRARKPGGTVPRSSPITIARWRCDSSASRPQQIVERIGEIGALGWRRAARHEPEPHQAHGMVDAHAAGMAQGGAQGGEERREAAARPAPAARRRSAPSPGRAD